MSSIHYASGRSVSDSHGMAQSPPQVTPPLENWSLTPDEQRPLQSSPSEYWQAEISPWDSIFFFFR